MFRKWITQAVIATHLPFNPFDGEMLPIERLRLYQWMNRFKPMNVLEVGTGVGGSTFYMSEALRTYGGKLYTCDPMRRPPKDFLLRFEGTLHFESLRSDELIAKLLNEGIRPDLVFFDGPEIPDLALDDIRALEPWLDSGCLFAMHDWEQAGGPNRKIVSIKAQKIRPYLEQSRQWRLLERLDGHQKNVWWTKGRYDSVGLCLYQYERSPACRLNAA